MKKSQVVGRVLLWSRDKFCKELENLIDEQMQKEISIRKVTLPASALYADTFRTTIRLVDGVMQKMYGQNWTNQIDK